MTSFDRSIYRQSGEGLTLQAQTSDPIPSQCTRSRICERLAKVCFVLGLGGIAPGVLLALAHGSIWYLSFYLCIQPSSLVIPLFLSMGFMLWRRANKSLRDLWPKPFQVTLSDLLVASLFTGLILGLGYQELDCYDGQTITGWYVRIPYVHLALGLSFLFALSVSRAKGKTGAMLVANALHRLLLSFGVLSLLAVMYNGSKPAYFSLDIILGNDYWGSGSHSEDLFSALLLRLGLFCLPLGLLLRRLVLIKERYVPSEMNGSDGRLWSAAQWTWVMGAFTVSFLFLRWPYSDFLEEWMLAPKYEQFELALLSFVLLCTYTILLCLASPKSTYVRRQKIALISTFAIASLAMILHYFGASRWSWRVIVVCGLALLVERVLSAQTNRLRTAGRAMLLYGLLSVPLLLLPAYLDEVSLDIAEGIGLGGAYRYSWGWNNGQALTTLCRDFNWPLHHGLFLALAGAAVLMVLWVGRRWSNRRAERRTA